MGRHSRPTEDKGKCAVHGYEINVFSWCDNFNYCEKAMELGEDYTCHTVKDCADFGCAPHEVTDGQT